MQKQKSRIREYSGSGQENSYLARNTIKTNQRVYMVALWSNLVGPCLALGTNFGLFEVGYIVSANILLYSVVMTLLLRWMNAHD